MAQYADVVLTSGAHPVNVICFNNAATAIPKGYAVLWETVAGYPRAVILPTAGAGRARTAGVTAEAIPAGGFGKVTVHGHALAYAGAVLATGDKVMADDTAGHEGEVEASSAAAATEELGWCSQAAAADGDLCEVFVNIHTLPKSA